MTMGAAREYNHDRLPHSEILEAHYEMSGGHAEQLFHK